MYIYKWYFGYNFNHNKGKRKFVKDDILPADD
jgi:hypothetical protein